MGNDANAMATAVAYQRTARAPPRRYPDQDRRFALRRVLQLESNISWRDRGAILGGDSEKGRSEIRWTSSAGRDHPRRPPKAPGRPFWPEPLPASAVPNCNLRFDGGKQPVEQAEAPFAVLGLNANPVRVVAARPPCADEQALDPSRNNAELLQYIVRSALNLITEAMLVAPHEQGDGVLRHVECAIRPPGCNGHVRFLRPAARSAVNCFTAGKP